VPPFSSCVVQPLSFQADKRAWWYHWWRKGAICSHDMKSYRVPMGINVVTVLGVGGTTAGGGSIWWYHRWKSCQQGLVL